METMKLYLSAFLMLAATTASAQFANSNASSVSNTSRNADTNGWQRISVSYNPTKIVYDYDGVDDLSVNGFSFGYTKGFSIAKEFPLFVEVGANATYSFGKEDYDDLGLEEDILERKTNLFSLNIPVNLAYKFSLPNGKVSIVPYLGVNFRGNIIGKQKYNLTIDSNELGFSEDEFWKEMEQKVEGFKQEVDMFDKKDTGSKDYTWKRFQMGWQIGVGLNYNQFYFSVGYGKDFTELCKKTKVATTSITLGYSF